MKRQQIKYILKYKDRLLCLTNVDNKKTQVLETLELGKCVTRPDLMGVPLMSCKSFDLVWKTIVDLHAFLRIHEYVLYT